MGSIFTEHVFPRYVGRQVMKPQMNGFNDPTLRDFSLLDSSVLMKEKRLFGGFCGRDSGIGPAQRAKTTIWN